MDSFSDYTIRVNFILKYKMYSNFFYVNENAFFPYDYKNANLVITMPFFSMLNFDLKIDSTIRDA